MNSDNPSNSQKLKTAGQAAQKKSNRDKTGGPRECISDDDHWIEIRLVGEDGVGIANQKCVITAADGSKHNGKTDAKGVLRIEGVPEGKCKVEFVDLDKDALA